MKADQPKIGCEPSHSPKAMIARKIRAPAVITKKSVSAFIFPFQSLFGS
jgi:hypothetical protein